MVNGSPYSVEYFKGIYFISSFILSRCRVHLHNLESQHKIFKYMFVFSYFYKICTRSMLFSQVFQFPPPNKTEFNMYNINEIILKMTLNTHKLKPFGHEGIQANHVNNICVNDYH